MRRDKIFKSEVLFIIMFWFLCLSACAAREARYNDERQRTVMAVLAEPFVKPVLYPGRKAHSSNKPLAGQHILIVNDKVYIINENNHKEVSMVLIEMVKEGRVAEAVVLLSEIAEKKDLITGELTGKDLAGKILLTMTPEASAKILTQLVMDGKAELAGSLIGDVGDIGANKAIMVKALENISLINKEVAVLILKSMDTKVGSEILSQMDKKAAAGILATLAPEASAKILIQLVMDGKAELADSLIGDIGANKAIMVKTLENISVINKEVAVLIIKSVDTKVGAEILSQMDEKVAAGILATMAPEASAKILTQLVTDGKAEIAVSLIGDVGDIGANKAIVKALENISLVNKEAVVLILKSMDTKVGGEVLSQMDKKVAAGILATMAPEASAKILIQLVVDGNPELAVSLVGNAGDIGANKAMVKALENISLINNSVIDLILKSMDTKVGADILSQMDKKVVSGIIETMPPEASSKILIQMVMDGKPELAAAIIQSVKVEKVVVKILENINSISNCGAAAIINSMASNLSANILSQMDAKAAAQTLSCNENNTSKSSEEIFSLMISGGNIKEVAKILKQLVLIGNPGVVSLVIGNMKPNDVKFMLDNVLKVDITDAEKLINSPLDPIKLESFFSRIPKAATVPAEQGNIQMDLGNKPSEILASGMPSLLAPVGISNSNSPAPENISW